MRRLLLAFLLLLGSLCARPALAAPRLEVRPCAIGGETVQCGRLEVPERWDRPGGRRIGLNVVVLPKTGDGPAGAPMVWLEGGPGVPGTISAPLYVSDLRFHRARRDVVLFDQRGAGQSNALRCPRLEAAGPLAPPRGVAEVVACRRALARRADLGAYSTAAAVADLEALRQALGAERLDLAGLSYGTWLAQAYMDAHPQRVRAAALIGAVPIGEPLPLHHAANGERALRLMFADCQADAQCDAAFPRLADDWRRLQQRLARRPPVIAGPHGPATVRPGPFNEWVRGQLNSVDGVRSLPRLIHRAASGDDTALAPLAHTAPQPEAEGMYLSVTCPEATAWIRPGDIATATRATAFGRYRVDRQVAECRAWSGGARTPAPPPMSRDIPLLLLAGGRDATTPPDWAQAIAAHAPRSRVVVIPPMTHVPVGLAHMECLDRLMDAFFAAGSAEGLDTGCVAAMAPPPFVTR